MEIIHITLNSTSCYHWKSDDLQKYGQMTVNSIFMVQIYPLSFNNLTCLFPYVIGTEMSMHIQHCAPNQDDT